MTENVGKECFCTTHLHCKWTLGRFKTKKDNLAFPGRARSLIWINRGKLSTVLASSHTLIDTQYEKNFKNVKESHHFVELKKS